MSPILRRITAGPITIVFKPMAAAVRMTDAATENLFNLLPAFPDFSKLRTNPAGFDRHHDRLHGADLLIRDAFLLGDAKIGLHSRITRCRHRGCEVDQKGSLLIKDLVVSGGFIELTKGPVLFFRKHHALLPPVSM
jgi:hypothetical protein